MEALTYPFDAGYILQNKRKLKKELLADGTVRVEKRIALLGGATTGVLRPILELFLLDMGVAPIFYESEYNRFWQDGMFGTPELDAFAPEIVYLHTCGRNVSAYPTPADDRAAVDAKLDAETARYTALWDALAARYHCEIIQNNFEMPAVRLLGNLDAVDYRGKTNFLRRLNARFADAAATRSAFHLHDVDYLSAVCGLDAWCDAGEWYLYKQSPATPCVPALCHSVACIVKAICGKNKKLLALDCDNTLWGGVVGDVGQQGLELGEETADGEAFREFQAYVKALSETGVVLSVDSKNDEENALAGLNHPDGVLRPDDFAVIKANWERKDQNLLQTVESLSLLPDCIVFADDNPAERFIVSSGVKGAAVPVLSNPADYAKVISRGGYFEPLALSGEDLARNAMYRENAKRVELEQSFTDYNEYLKSLAMVAPIGDFPEIYRKRIAQLANKSNQFNLTTRRYTEAEIEQIAVDERYIRVCGKLIDRFGDNGVVSVIIAEKDEADPGVADIRLWIMSCRVLKRGMEQLMRNELLAAARKAGVKTLRGHYYPTAKNGMVRDLLGTLGFDKVAEDAEGNTVWRIATNAEDIPVVIQTKAFEE